MASQYREGNALKNKWFEKGEPFATLKKRNY